MAFTHADIESRLAEYGGVHPDPGCDELSLLETALFLEEAFGVRVRDEDITPQNLGSFDGMKRFLLAQGGRA